MKLWARYISRQISEIELAFELAFAFEFEMHKKCNKVFQLNFLCILIYCEMGIEIKIQVQLQFFSPVHKTCQKFGEFAKCKFNFGNLTTNEPGPSKWGRGDRGVVLGHSPPRKGQSLWSSPSVTGGAKRVPDGEPRSVCVRRIE